MKEVEEQKALVEHEGMWPAMSEESFIYRVPTRLRSVNPDAYTPRMLLIGPLHHSKKAQAKNISERYPLRDQHDQTESTYQGYLNMEHHKKLYASSLAERVSTENVRRFIEKNEKSIRSCYAESTEWIESSDFVNMIFDDSIFIFEFILRVNSKQEDSRLFISADMLVDNPFLVITVYEDLLLLENQIPYILLEAAFEPITQVLFNHQITFRELVLRFFRFDQKIKDTTIFLHFTDLMRCARVELLDLRKLKKKAAVNRPENLPYINADKLDSAGVEFKSVEDNLSLDVKFEKGCLKIPRFRVDDEIVLIVTRNVMAFEQCHYPYEAAVCNYMIFLHSLINTDKDVDFLLKKGILINWVGRQASVADMVNSLCRGVIGLNSVYADIVDQLNAHCQKRINRSLATLRRVYFNNLWTSTATIAATVLLILTFIQAVASVIQVRQGGKNGSPTSPPPPPPPRAVASGSTSSSFVTPYVSTLFVILCMCGCINDRLW